MQISMTTPEENPSIPQSQLAPHAEPPPGKYMITLLIDDNARKIELFRHMKGGRGLAASVDYVKLRHGLKFMLQLLRQMLAR